MTYVSQHTTNSQTLNEHALDQHAICGLPGITSRRSVGRRGFLCKTLGGFAWLALAALNARPARADKPAAGSRSPLAPKRPHFEPRAKRVIFLFMQGGPSHLETFDWKPALASASKPFLPPAFAFRPCGRSGLMLSEVMPHLAAQADELCLLNGMQTNNPGHQQAIVALHTGNETFVRPSLGAWTVYGLGTDADDLPGFVTIDPITDLGGAMNYGSAFLPATYQGTRLISGGSGIPHLRPHHLVPGDQRRQLDLIQKLNGQARAHAPDHPQLAGLPDSFELAYKMQSSVPDALAWDKEPASIQRLYGLEEPQSRRFGTACLMARRLAERGVRFVQVTSTGWDHHNRVREGMIDRWAAVDQPIAALIADLKDRGMLQDTLVVWGGEFGRGAREDNPGGRGHNAAGYTMWMAGGGVKGGYRHGATDELGERAVEGIVGTHDLHATMLHLLGLDHTQLTFRYAGRDFRLTDTSGEVVRDILA